MISWRTQSRKVPGNRKMNMYHNKYKTSDMSYSLARDIPR